MLQSLATIAVTLLVSLLSPKRLLLVASLSPWSLGLLATRVVPNMLAFTLSFYALQKNRIPPLPSAISTLQERVGSGRAYRCRRYDVYLPKDVVTATTKEEQELKQARLPPVLCFFPGALVHHTAYADVASKLSDHGILVVVLSMEPMRLGMWGGLGASRRRMLKTFRELFSSELPLGKWRRRSVVALGGHSLGAFTAMKLSQELDATHLIMWGASPNFESVHTDISTDASSSLEPSHLHCLVVQATQDAMCQPSSKDVLQRFLDRFPKSTTFFHTIQGGSHDQFGSYHAAGLPYNGISEVDTDQFHDQLCLATSKFLLQKQRQQPSRSEKS